MKPLPSLAILISVAVILSGFGAEAAKRKFYCLGEEATIVGGDNGFDNIYGTDGRDVIVARSGNDNISTGGGDDVVCAGPGADEVFLGEGYDIVVGGPGDDELFASGNDRIKGGGGSDSLYAGLAGDRFRGGVGIDTLVYRDVGSPIRVDLEAHLASGDRGTDEFPGESIENVEIGGQASAVCATWDDTVIGNSLDNVFEGGAGHDSFHGRNGDDRIVGGNLDWPESDLLCTYQDGNDQLDGGNGDDELLGQGNDDFLIGGLGTDSLNGGSGTDSCTEGESVEGCE